MRKILYQICIPLLVLFLFSCQKKHFNEWIEEKGHRYYYNEQGQMLKSCIETIGANKYAFDINGNLLIDTPVTVADVHYISDESGKLVENGFYRYHNTNTYYIKDYILQSGWIQNNGDWYYFSPSDYSMAITGWVDNQKYYVEGGKMVANTVKKIGGKTYTFDESGKANYTGMIKIKLPIYERTVYEREEYNHDESDYWPVNFYLEYDKDDSIQNLFGNKQTYIYSKRDYVKMSQINLCCDLGLLRQQFKNEPLLEATFYRENGTIYDKGYIYIISTDGMRYRLWSDTINIDLTETENITIKLKEYNTSNY